MPFVEWSAKLFTDIPIIDDHHHQLVDLINALYDGVFNCENLEQERNLTQYTLLELLRYAEYHFAAEEKLMLACNYPGCEGHKQEHAQFVHRVGELLTDYKQGKPVLSFDTFLFLKEWLTSHIARTDQQYLPYVPPTKKEA